MANRNIHTARLPEGFTVTAHTGSMGSPDNSIESLIVGMNSGADIIEFDLNFTDDKTPVLSHNAPETDAVLLSDALAVISKNSSIRMNIDVKTPDDLAAVEKFLKEYGLDSRAFMTGISMKFIPAVKEQCSYLTYYLNYYPEESVINDDDFLSETARIVKECGALGLNLNHSLISPKLVEYMHREKLLVSGWTANDEETMIKLINAGVDNITTCRPDELIKLIADNR